MRSVYRLNARKEMIKFVANIKLLFEVSIMIRLLAFVIIVCSNITFAQSKVDSLLQVIDNTNDDATLAEAYFQLGRYAEKIYLRMEYLEKAAQYASSADIPITEAGAYNSLGILYYELGDYEKTLEFFYKVMNIHQSTGDKELQSKAYNNIGLILTDLGRTKEALDYYERSLVLKRELDNQLGVANTLSNMALIYDQEGKYQQAHNYYKIALKIDRENNRTFDVFKDLSNMGDNYTLQKKYDSADYYYEQAVAMMHEVDEPYYKAELLESLAKFNALREEYSRAIEKYNMALMIAENIDARALEKNHHLGLSEIYKKIGDFEKSLGHFEKYMAIEKELFNQEQAQKLAQIEENFQIQSQEIEIDLLNKEAEIKDLRLSNTQDLIYGLILMLLLIGIIVFLQYRKNMFKSRANDLLQKQNEEIAMKNKNIMDSILCAKNIQEAILPDDDKLGRVFSDAFVFSRPRDIVNGDFYWFADHNDHILVAAVDCTGHGVPAAFLNVLGNSMLNQIVYESNLVQPGEILEELNKRIQRTIKAEKLYAQVDDGMDIGLCMINKKTRNLCFAGAKRPLYVFNNGEFKEIKGDHVSVGGNHDAHAYTEHSVEMVEGDTLYLFTDGIVDQFGGEKNKKFMYPRLRKLLQEIFHKPLTEQREIIQERLTSWQGNNEQTDDMLLISVKV